jgi:hypothetical protein
MEGTGKTRLPVSHHGTYPCAKWPQAKLYDYNDKADTQDRLRKVKSLADLSVNANVTVVGQFYADDAHSRATAAKLAQMTREIQLKYGSLKVSTVFLNNWLPYKCAMEPACTTPNGKSCIGGCLPGDSALRESNWQGLYKPTDNISYLQDTKELQMWRSIGGGKDDLIIYDSQGYVFGYACGKDTCAKPPSFSNDLTTPAGFANVQSLIILAGNSAPIARCMTKADPLLKHLAPTTLADNEAVDIIVVTIVLIVGMCIGAVVIPKLLSFIQRTCGFGATVEASRDRFIQLSTIDDDDGDNFDL